MRVGFRLVTGALHHVDIDDPAGTVAMLKDAIAPKGNLDRASVKVCFKGRVLDDDTATLPAAGLSENDTVVVIGKVLSVTAVAPPPPPPPAASGPLDALVAMGFTRPMVEQAMFVCENDPQRAVEYLVSGGGADGVLPDDEEGDDEDDDDMEEDEEDGDDATELIDALAAIPQFEQARLLVVQNNMDPTAFGNALCANNPALRPLIDANPEAFQVLVQFGIPPDDDDDDEEEEGEDDDD